MAQEKLDTPNWLVSAVEPIQDKLALRGLARLIAGSKSPAYVQAHWKEVDQVVDADGNTASLPIAEANIDAPLLTSILPRLKDRVAVSASGYFDMEEILETYNAMPVVAYTYKNKTHAGLLYERSLGVEHIPSYPQALNTSAARVGRSWFGTGHGGLIPAERVLVLPRDLKVIRQKLPIEQLDTEFPHTPLS